MIWIPNNYIQQLQYCNTSIEIWGKEINATVTCNSVRKDGRLALNDVSQLRKSWRIHALALLASFHMAQLKIERELEPVVIISPNLQPGKLSSKMLRRDDEASAHQQRRQISPIRRCPRTPAAVTPSLRALIKNLIEQNCVIGSHFKHVMAMKLSLVMLPRPSQIMTCLAS